MMRSIGGVTAMARGAIGEHWLRGAKLFFHPSESMREKKATVASHANGKDPG